MFDALSSGTCIKLHMLVTWVSKEPLQLYSDTSNWNNIHQDCAYYIANCPGCQVNKTFPLKTAGGTRPLSVQPYRWHTVTTDYVTGLPETENGHDAMAIFVDKLTEWVHLKPCKISSDGQDWADKFMDSVNVNQGMTGHVLSDRGPQLRGEFDQGLARLPEITWDLTSPYKPSLNSITACTHRTLEGTMRQIV